MKKLRTFTYCDLKLNREVIKNRHWHSLLVIPLSRQQTTIMAPLRAEKKQFKCALTDNVSALQKSRKNWKVAKRSCQPQNRVISLLAVGDTSKLMWTFTYVPK